MARDANGFTPTQARIMEVLGDGEWHSRRELFRVIDDEDPLVLRQHIFQIRQILKEKGMLITYSSSPTSGLGVQISRHLMPMKNG